MTRVSDLSDDLLQYIGDWLHGEEEPTHLDAVCQRWRRVFLCHHRI